MEIISHRINSLDELINLPKMYGAEIDVRSFGNELIVHHDPFVQGIKLDHWLSHYQHGTLIFNVKEEGLEDAVIGLAKKNNITNFFFLDQSFPFLIKTALEGERRCAVRWSEFESLETVLSIADKIDWVWLDCFSHFPVDRDSIEILKQTELKVCVVSPELQGRQDSQEVSEARASFEKLGFDPDAVCTKRPQLWS